MGFDASCSTTTMVRQGQDLIVDDPGVLITKAGVNLSVRHTLLRNDSMVVIVSRMERKARMPVDSVAKLVIRNRSRGAWQGMLLSAGLFGILGAIPDPDCGDPCLFPNGGLQGSIFWSAFGAGFGAVWGAALGSNRTYVFEHLSSAGDSAHHGE